MQKRDTKEGSWPRIRRTLGKARTPLEEARKGKVKNHNQVRNPTPSQARSPPSCPRKNHHQVLQNLIQSNKVRNPTSSQAWSPHGCPRKNHHLIKGTLGKARILGKARTGKARRGRVQNHNQVRNPTLSQARTPPCCPRKNHH